LAKEQFFHRETQGLLDLLDTAARQAGKSRGQTFEDFLELVVCTLSGGTMEPAYLAVAKRYADGEKGKRGIDTLARAFGHLVQIMEETKAECHPRDGLFQRADIPYLECDSPVAAGTLGCAARSQQIWRDPMRQYTDDHVPPRARQRL
jgi:hypothetical protein